MKISTRFCSSASITCHAVISNTIILGWRRTEREFLFLSLLFLGAQAESSNLLLTISVTSGLFPANNPFHIAQGHSVTVTEGNRSWQLLWSHDPSL